MRPSFLDRVKASVRAAVATARGARPAGPRPGAAASRPPAPGRRERPDPDAALPLADELTATEAAVYGGEAIFATSSWIDHWYYLGDRQQLFVAVKGAGKSRSGRGYRLDGVPFAVALAFYRSDSPGRFFNWHLRGKYGGARLGSVPTAPGRNVVTTLD